MATLKNTSINDTGYIRPAAGTTAQRPGTPSAGMVRWNTTDTKMEVYDGTEWKALTVVQTPLLYDDFTGASLDTSTWSTFGTTYGSITVSNGICSVNNATGETGTTIGMYSNQTFGVGTTITVRSRIASGRHGAMIGFGASPYPAYPQYTSPPVIGFSWYGRNDDSTSTINWYDENGTSSPGYSHTQNTNSFQVFKVVRESSTNFKVYRNDVLEANATATFAGNYSVFFTAEGWSNTNRSGLDDIVEIDYIEVTQN